MRVEEAARAAVRAGAVATDCVSRRSQDEIRGPYGRLGYAHVINAVFVAALASLRATGDAGSSVVAGLRPDDRGILAAGGA